jgi:tetratricopeptide (TPR) repeat protein
MKTAYITLFIIWVVVFPATATLSIDSLINLSVTYRQSDRSLSHRYANEAYQMALLSEKPEMISLACNEMGVLYYQTGEYMTAVSWYKKALAYDRQTGNRQDEAMRLNNIGQAYSSMGNFSLALDYLSEALMIDREFKDSARIATRLNNIGIVYYKFEQFQKALDFFREAWRIDSLRKDTTNFAIRLNNLGKVYLNAGKYAEAEKCFLQALDVDKKTKNERDMAIRFSNLGQTYAARGDNNKALGFFQKALAIDSRFSYRPGMASDLYYIGICLKNTNRTKEAGEYFLMAEEQAEMIDDADILIKIYNELARIEEKSGNISKSLDYYKKWASLKDSVYNAESRKKLADFQSYYESEKKERELESLQMEMQINQISLKQKDDELKSQQISKLWFITLLILVIILILFVYFVRLQKEKKKQLQLKQQLNLYMQKALIQQMNPHFFFNTLNSIQYYILKNDKVTSNKYLSMFARLMRTTLNNSQHESISLADELEALKTYIELEQLRFVNKFDYRIEIDSEADVNNISLPPFILQPYIENAIWHGLMQMENDKQGMLLLSISRKDKWLICAIEDNGIGREKAMELSHNSGKHVSLGTRITETRIDLINQLYNSKLNVKYNDLYDAEGNPSGTRVEISLGIDE